MHRARHRFITYKGNTVLVGTFFQSGQLIVSVPVGMGTYDVVQAYRS